MSYQKYSLEVISHHPKFKNKNLRKYYVDGIETVGAWGDEPFEVVFKNHSRNKVQVKLSIDGTDILTGKPATTDLGSDMWVVNGYDSLSLKAWPETNNGGAQLVFTSATNSVALHTHGDLSSRGIIAAAVYEETHVEKPVMRTKDVYFPVYPTYPSYPIVFGDRGYFEDTVITCNNTFDNDATNTSFSANSIQEQSVKMKDCTRGLELESLVAVGAGQHVDQKITNVAGLIKPMFTETVRVKYMWWDDLVSKLRTHNVPAPHPSGFPGDQKKTNINLGDTPRVGSQMNKVAEPLSAYSRI